MAESLILYHGTIYLFDTIDITRGKPYKDFGIGFYTSRDREHAKRMALRNKEIELSRMRQQNKISNINALLYTYEIDSSNLNNLNSKEFKTANREWMRFVILNRTEKEQKHNYDMVIGHTANDNTLTAIGLFFAGAYGDTGTDIAVDRLIKRLEPEKLPWQYFFGSNTAVELLIFKNREVLQ